MLAAQAVSLGDVEIAVAGGMESMSNAPYLLPRVREGLRMGDATVVDAMIHDGLWCAFEHCHMGVSGEYVAEQFGVSRDAQDAMPPRAIRKPRALPPRDVSNRRSCRSRFLKTKARRS